MAWTSEGVERKLSSSGLALFPQGVSAGGGQTQAQVSGQEGLRTPCSSKDLMDQEPEKLLVLRQLVLRLGVTCHVLLGGVQGCLWTKRRNTGGFQKLR